MRSLLIKEGLSMPVLSIVACEMLEDELVYALSKDPEIKRLFVIENRNSFRFVKKLKSEHLKPFVFSPEKLYPLISEINRKSFGNPMGKLSNFPLFKKTYDVIFNKKQQKLTVVVNLLRKDLHSDIDLLQSEVYLNAKEMSKISNGVLLFYGKCGFSSEKMQAELQKLGCPICFLRDEGRNIVDDCISVALGGNEIYTKTMLLGNGKGAIYATPMWLSELNETNYKSSESYQKISKYLTSPMYSLLFKINNQLYKDANFHRNASEFAKIFNMNIINVNGTMKIAINSYMEAKTDIYKNLA
ncbi:hypothetical protein MSHOH_2215 [Methanosarcina horonobensis HB-1 = JCM 15518]|uniref:DUF1638 domain-containing protein n=1 Tax=Methanosarcina horonobensis HB-1 = JCM 15518 TaxID=1434110 RepID=A0A0E3SGL1_9EURY|nr:DUF1638 domain-containing protein [Methanosarcina horonobensis]AKB78698.1 hypothetical protein MSHOH_2215 [Methanosarcina horonobensis HB-1 = JCM 15518]